MVNFYRAQAKLVGDLKPSTLFVAEGETEAYFLDTILELREARSSECCVFCLRGLSRLNKKLEVVTKQDNFDSVRSLCFMLDAENDVEGRLQSIKDGCRRVGFMNVRNLPVAGTLTRGNKRLGVFVSPGDGNNGRIEDVILKEIAAKPEYECIEQYETCMARDHGNDLDAKSVVQTYISSVNGSLCGAGRAFQAGILNPLDAAYADARQVIEDML